MFTLKNWSLQKKLLTAFLAVGLIPFALTSFMGMTETSKGLEQQAFNQLKGLREIKSDQIL